MIIRPSPVTHLMSCITTKTQNLTWAEHLRLKKSEWELKKNKWKKTPRNGGSIPLDYFLLRLQQTLNWLTGMNTKPQISSRQDWSTVSQTELTVKWCSHRGGKNSKDIYASYNRVRKAASLFVSAFCVKAFKLVLKSSLRTRTWVFSCICIQTLTVEFF